MPDVYPSSRSYHWQALGSTGSVQHACSPASQLLWLTPTPDPHPAWLLFRRQAVPPGCSQFRSSRAPRHCTRRPGEFGFGFSSADHSVVEGIGSPRFLDNPNVNMPCSLTPVGRSVPASVARPYSLPQPQRRRLPRQRCFVAQSHGLLTRCLRFTLSVTGHGARLASGWLPAFAGWDSHPLGRTTQFPEISLLSKHPGLLAH